ncbi:MAG TPA: winged helix-turn-helix domain-containing protein [Terriglobales bacterium]|nr:winged helix-turn-helix domain-containing protein [Terriglobales bacterium]
MKSQGQITAYRFGPFEADARAGELRMHGRRVPLQQQPFDVLLIMLHEPGELITREQLRQSIWPENTFVEFDCALNTAVKKIRVALRDDANAPRYVETVPKRGYRFRAKVQVIAGTANSPPEKKWLLYAWLGALVLSFLAGYWCHAIWPIR